MSNQYNNNNTPKYQEINLTESKLREAKKSQSASFKASMKNSMSGTSQG
jgi:hypothetical protein